MGTILHANLRLLACWGVDRAHFLIKPFHEPNVGPLRTPAQGTLRRRNHTDLAIRKFEMLQITVVERAKMESKNGERANMYANWTLNGHLPRAPSPLIILLPRCRETRKREGQLGKESF